MYSCGSDMQAGRRATAMQLERQIDCEENGCCVLAGLSQLQRRQEQLQVQQHANMLRRSRNGAPEDSSRGLMNWGSHLVKVGRLGACTTRRDILRFFEVFDIDENSIRSAIPSWTLVTSASAAATEMLSISPSTGTLQAYCMLEVQQQRKRTFNFEKH